MRRILMGALLLGLVLGMASCYAPPPRPARPPGPPPAVQAHPDIPAQIANQQKRIDQGIASGQLTRNEAAVLQDNLNWIRAEHARLSAYGRLTPRDVNMLEMRLQQNDQMIFDRKNNPVRRIY